MKKKYIIWAVVLVLVVAAVVVFAGLRKPTGPAGSLGIFGQGSEDIPFADKYLDLKISQTGFSPEKFRARKSDQLHITLINEDKENHNTLKFEDLPFDAIVPNDGKVTFTVIVPSEPGEYVFYTDVGEKRTGVLIVE